MSLPDRSARGKHYEMTNDATAPNFKPWWLGATPEQIRNRIERLQYVIHFCRGSAADHRKNVIEHIKFLEKLLPH